MALRIREGLRLKAANFITNTFQVWVFAMPERKTDVVFDMTEGETVVHPQGEDPEDYRNTEGKTVFGTTEDDKGDEKTVEYSQHLSKLQKEIVKALKDNPDADTDEIAEISGASKSTVGNAVNSGTIGMPLYTDEQILRAILSLSERDQDVVEHLSKGPDRDLKLVADKFDVSKPTVYNIKSNNEPLIFRLFNHEEPERFFDEAEEGEGVEIGSGPADGVDVDPNDYFDSPTTDEQEESIPKMDALSDSDDISGASIEAASQHIAMVEELRSLHAMYERQVHLSGGDVPAAQVALCEHLLGLTTGEDG